MVGIVFYTVVLLWEMYLVYKVFFGVEFQERKLPYLFVLLVACAVQGLVFYMVDDTWVDGIVVFGGLPIAVALTKKKRWKTIAFYPVTVFMASFLNIAVSYLMAFLLDKPQMEISDSVWLCVLCESVTAFCLVLVWRIIKAKRKEEISLTVGQYIILFLGAICFIVVITFLQGLLKNDITFAKDMKEKTIYACLIIAFCFILLSIWQQITWKKTLIYQVNNKKYEEFLTGQEAHIRMLMIEDEKRRKLRHDMNAHMLAMNTMAENEDWLSLKEYLAAMQKSLDEAKVGKYTMISAVDAIIDDYRKRAKDCQVNWHWEGVLNHLGRITVFDLCIMFSNLLRNALEAVEKLEEGRQIETKVSDFQGKMVLIIRNTCRETIASNRRPKTTKNDTVFHGLGLINVEEIVKKYEGKIEYEIADGWFQVSIIL